MAQSAIAGVDGGKVVNGVTGKASARSAKDESNGKRATGHVGDSC